MSFLYIFNNEIRLYVVLFILLVASSGILGEHCNIIDDEGQTDKIYCEIGCCGPLENSYCCIEDDAKFASYYYGYKVAGAVVGFIFGFLALVSIGRCIFGIWRERTIYVTTVEPGAEHGTTRTTTTEEYGRGDAPVQRPSMISYSEDNPLTYGDEERLVN